MRRRSLTLWTVMAGLVAVPFLWVAAGGAASPSAGAPAQFLSAGPACNCQDLANALQAAMDRLQDLQDQFRDTDAQLDRNQQQQADAQGRRDEAQAEFDRQLGDPSSDNPRLRGAFVSSGDTEVRYNSQGQIQTYQNGKPVPGTARNSPYMSGLRQRIDQANAELTKLQAEQTQLEQQKQRLEKEIPAAQNEVDALRQKLDDCLNRCQAAAAQQEVSRLALGLNLPLLRWTLADFDPFGAALEDDAAAATTDPAGATPPPAFTTGGSTFETGDPAQQPGLGVNNAALGDSSDQIFTDGFESGDTSSWSATVGDIRPGGRAQPVDDRPLDDAWSKVLQQIGATTSPTYYNFDAFEEMQVTTGGSDASIATGSVTLNMVTKPSVNEWRVSARYTLSDPGAFGVFDEVEGPPSSSTPDVDDAADRLDSVLGGPIVKDRLWIWGSYGAQQLDIPDIQDILDVLPADRTALENNALNLFGGGSYDSETYRTGTVRYRLPGPEGPRLGYPGGAPPPNTTWSQEGPTDIYKIEDTHVFNSSFFLTGMASYVGGGFALVPQGGNLPGDGSPSWGNSFQTFQTDRPQDRASLDGNYFFNSGNTSHDLRFGVGLRNAQVGSMSAWPGGTTLPTGQGFGGPGVYPVPGGAVQDRLFTNAYVQDTLNFGNLTTNMGLRYDLQEPAAGSGSSSVLPTDSFDWETITPRIGLTYALGEERKTLLRASYSRFADQLGTGILPALNPLAGLSYAYFSTGALPTQTTQSGDPFSSYRLDDTIPTSELWGSDPPTDRFSLPSTDEPSFDDRFVGSFLSSAFPDVGLDPSSFLNSGGFDQGFYGLGSSSVANVPLTGFPATGDYQLIVTIYVNRAFGDAADTPNFLPGARLEARPPWLARAAAGARDWLVTLFELPGAHAASRASLALRRGPAPPMPGRGARMALAGGQSAGGDTAISVVATGASSGEVFELQVLGPSGEPTQIVAPDALVLQPIRPGAGQPLSPEAGRQVETAPMTGFCLEYDKPPPPQGTLYQVAPANVQQQFQPMRDVLRAGRALAEAGLLNPDSDPGAYATFIQQWAVWSRLEGWDLNEFTREFVDRTRQNVANLGGQWTNQMADVLRQAAPNRYNDILAVLVESEGLSRSAGD